MRFLCALATFILLSLASEPLLAAERLTLLDTLPEPDTSSNPANFKRVGNLLFFNANGSEIWVTDGTEDGTRKTSFTGTIDDTYYASDTALYRYKVSSAYAMPSLVEYKDGPEGPLQATLVEIQCDGPATPPSGFQNAIAEYKGEIYFRANAKLDESQPDYGIELVAVKRGAIDQYRIVEDIYSGPDSSTPRAFRLCDGLLFFVARQGTKANIFYADGTSVNQIPSDSLSRVQESDNVLYFFTSTTIYEGTSPQYYIYTLNKRESVTGFISSLGSIQISAGWPSPTSMTPNGSGLFFVNLNDIWRTSLDGQTIEQLTNNVFHTPERLTVAGGNLYFTALSVSNNNKELWRINPAGEAVLLKEISPGTASTEFFGMAEMNGDLYFQCKDAEGKNALWKSDGTSEGTAIIASFDNETLSIAMARMNNHLLFPADDYKHGIEPHISDGTENGTEMLANLRATPVSPALSTSISAAAVAGGKVFFLENCGFTYSILRTTKGVPEICKSVCGIPYGGRRAPLFSLFNNNEASYAKPIAERIIVSTNDGIYASDGNSTGTFQIVPDFVSTYPATPRLDVIGNNGFLQVSESGIRTDGTLAGTIDLVDLLPDSGGSYFNQTTPILGLSGANVILKGNDSEHGLEIWRTNGTPAGTKLVKDIYPGDYSSNPGGGRMAGSTVYFSATTPEAGTELWRTNGSEAGTKLVEDIVPGTGSSNPSCLGATDTAVMIFSANGNELWRSNGNAAGTYLLKDTLEGTTGRSFEYVGTHLGKVFISARSPYGFPNLVELWVSDGTVAGTKKITETSGASSHYRYLGVLGERLFVSNPSGQICAVDGSEVTVISTNTSQGVFSDKYFYQCIGQSEHGTTFLRSDGTTEGTQQFTAPSPGSSPVLLGILDGHLVYSLRDDTTNVQNLWAFDVREDAAAQEWWKIYQ